MPLSHSSDDFALPPDLEEELNQTKDDILKPPEPPEPDAPGQPNGSVMGIKGKGKPKKFMAPPSTDATPLTPLAPTSGLSIVAPGPEGGEKRAVSYKDLLVFFGDGDTIKPILYNVLTVLKHDREWAEVLAWDEFNQTIVTEKVTPWGKPKGERWGDVDDSLLANWLQKNKIIVSSNLAAEAVNVAAKKRPMHPVQAYLKSLKWDQVERIEGWLSRYMGVEDKPVVRAFASRWLISAIARAMRPGCQADHTLLLEGAQGTRKSTALRTLASDPWFTDHISDLHDKDSRMELQGKWIVELSELHAIKGKGMEAVKSFLTTRVDSFRPPWARHTQSLARHCVFAATTNDDEALTDETGNRRFWPVRCGTIDIPGLEQDRDQLWAEAFSLWVAGKVWWLDSDDLVEESQREQASHYQSGPYDEKIEKWLEDPQPSLSSGEAGTLAGSIMGSDDPPFMSELGRVTITDILIHALNIRDVKGRPDLLVNRYLKAHGWKRVQSRKAGERGKRFWIPLQTLGNTKNGSN